MKGERTVEAFLKFNKGVMRLPIYWQAWMVLLVGANMIAPMFFLNRVEAQVTLAAFLASVVLMTVLTSRFGFTRILGLGHIFWVPLLVFLFLRLSSIPADDTFGIWIRILLLLNGISLLIDTNDVVHFIAGDRQETDTGLKE